MVLFPERIGDRYWRLERPFALYGHRHMEVWAASSPDLRDWGGQRLVLGSHEVAFADDKVGPAAPPIRTESGWLTTFHAVRREPGRGKSGWEPKWEKTYEAGLEDPRRVIGICREPLLTPQATYETDGFRNHVIFPTGMILADDNLVHLYYGAADAVMALATAPVNALVSRCTPIDKGN